MLRFLLTKLTSSKIRVNFFSTTDIMKYCKNYLPYSILASLCSLTPETLETNYLKDQKSIQVLIKENFDYVLRLKRSVRVILSHLRHRRLRRTALIKRMKAHVKSIIKI